jgi:hypothetical protein
MSMEGAAPQEGEGVGVGGAAMNSPRRAPITPSQTVWPCIEEVRGSLPRLTNAAAAAPLSC